MFLLLNIQTQKAVEKGVKSPLSCSLFHRCEPPSRSVFGILLGLFMLEIRGCTFVTFPFYTNIAYFLVLFLFYLSCWHLSSATFCQLFEKHFMGIASFNTCMRLGLFYFISVEEIEAQEAGCSLGWARLSLPRCLSQTRHPVPWGLFLSAAYQPGESLHSYMVTRLLLGHFFMCSAKIELLSPLPRAGDTAMSWTNMVSACRVASW